MNQDEENQKNQGNGKQRGQDDNGMAVASLVLGIDSVVCACLGSCGGVIGLACGIIAIVLGRKACKNGSNGMATAGFACGIVGVSLCALLLAACACLIRPVLDVIRHISEQIQYY